MKSGAFFAELKRRHVYRAGVIYAMTSWLLIQIATQVFPFFEIPNSVVRLIVIALAGGFPVAVALAWAFEITPEGIVKTGDAAPPSPARVRASRRIDFVIIGILAIAIGFLLFLRYRPAGQKDAESAIPEKSIAVLPFENFSDNKENAYFADGIQDNLLTELAKIQSLKVISRTSVMRYRDTVTRNIREIARTLGVANILEGSVRRENDRVAVNVQLIDALHDRHIWAHRYDRTVADSLGLEGELATEISGSLRAQLTPDEKARVARKATDSFPAFDLYLQGRYYEFKPDTFLQDYRTAEQLYVQAITLDPKFALAHARLAATCARIYHFYKPTEEWKKRAQAEAETALRLQPSLGEAHHALGLCYYWFERDYPRALREFEIARALLPNDSTIPWDIAAIKRRQGHWNESIANYLRILQLDPQNANVVRDLLYTYCATRDWPNAEATAERLMALTPDSINAKAQVGYTEFWARGTTARLKREMATVPPGQDPDGSVTAYRMDACLIGRDPDAAERALRSSPLDTFSYFNGVDTPRQFFAGEIALLRGNQDSARSNFQQARDAFAALATEAPDAPERHAFLGLACAFAGDKERAIKEGRKAVELRPETRDALDGTIFQAVLALIYARTGEKDLALNLLQHLLSEPGPVDSANYSVTVSDLKSRWEWDLLRDDPRFKKLLTSNQTLP